MKKNVKIVSYVSGKPFVTKYVPEEMAVAIKTEMIVSLKQIGLSYEIKVEELE